MKTGVAAAAAGLTYNMEWMLFIYSVWQLSDGTVFCMNLMLSSELEIVS